MAKDSRGLRLFSVGVLALCAMIIAMPGHTAVGRTAGSFSVSNAGAATYTIPIFTPPGPNGLQPSVALTYNSNVDKGILGRGWSLAGFSSIERCNKTIAQDGSPVAFNLQTVDAYCLDGNRLRLQSGTYGISGSVYMTEIADFSRITASGASGNGPQYWTVERKDGLIYTYGGTSDSRVMGYPPVGAASALVWKLSQIQDRAGNKVRFTWKAHDDTTYGTSHPVKIEWTQTSAGSGSYVYSMDFAYSAGGNAPASSIYRQFGWYMYIRDADLLTGITVSVSGTVKRKYVLTYENSPSTGGKRLTQVKECSDSAATDCLSPTSITYQNGTAGVNVGSPLLSMTDVGNANGDYDFNGDGIKDIAYQPNSGIYFGIWHVRLGSPSSGYGSAISTGLTTLNAGKLLGTDADQLFAVSGGTWYVYYLNGSSFSSISTGVTVAASSANVVPSDVDGDGRDDLVYVTGWSDINWAGGIVIWFPTVDFAVRRNTSSGGSLAFAAPINSTANQVWYTPWDRLIPIAPEYAEDPYFADASYADMTGGVLSKGGDVDGDGRQELNFKMSLDRGNFSTSSPTYPYPVDSVVESDYITFNASLQAETVPIKYWGAPIDASLTANDFDGNGCDDFVISDPYAGFMAALSGCTYAYVSGVTGWLVGSADWTGDGASDYFYLDFDYPSTLHAYAIVADQPIWAGATDIPASCVLIRTDGNGDDLDDIGCLAYGNLTIYKHNGTAIVPDLLSQIQDGFGVTYSPSYTSIQRGNYTAYTNSIHPYRDVKSDRRVVGSVTAIDGIGGTYTTTYNYFGALKNLEGRGFLGFDKIESVDSRSGIKHEQQFELAFPYSGRVKVDKFYQPAGSGGHLISEKTVTASSTTLDATSYNQRYFTYISAITEDVYEVGGASNTAWITRTAVSNTHDSSGNLTGSTRTVTDKDSSSPKYLESWTEATSLSITPNTTYWCLGLPTASSTTYSTTVSGESSVTQSKSFTPDYVNCRMNGDSVEPGSSTLRVDTSYGYDGFGNVNSVSVTGRNPNGSSMSARTATTSWGTTGQFPVSSTNPLSQTTTRTFHSTFGSLLTQTDPNSIVVTNEHDSFGRTTRSIRGDGTATRISYNACATYGCQNGDPASGATGINKMIVIASERDTGDNPIRDAWSYTDQFDRSIVQLSQTLAGGYSRTGRQYDALGRVDRETAPCTSGSCTAYWVTNTYDLLGRPLTQSRPFSDSNATPVTTTFAYAGRAQTITDPNSKVTTKVMDVNSRMRQSRDHDSYGQNFSYDAAGSLKGVTDTLSNTLFTASYGYGAKPFQTATTDMDLGSWSYTYNSLGELLSWTDANSNSFSQTYDGISRVTSRTESEGTTTFTYGTSAGSHNIGQLSEVSMTGYSEALSYDSIGRPSTRSITADSDTYNIDYAYNTKGLLDTLTYPTSTSSTRVKVKYGYANGILQSVTDWTTGSAGTVYWTANTQNPRGQTTQETLGNGVVTNRNFDAVTGRLNSIQSGLSGGTGLQNQSYLYDALGNVTQRQESTLGLTESFYYDNLYRLDYSTLNNGGGAATNLDLTYNAMGNITQRSDVNGNAAWTYHGTRKHAVATTGTGGTSYSYDNNGNMTSRGGQTIGWSSYNYPTYLTTATENTYFTYGPDRQYYKQDYTGPSVSETTYYIGGILEKVISGGTTDWRHTIMTEGQTVAIVSRKSTSVNTVSYPLEDNQGSSSTLTNGSGTLLTRQSFNAFGLPRDGSDWDGAVPGGDLTTIEGLSRRGYTGHSMLGRMGLIHMNGRVQDAVTGRFLSPDPTIPNPGFTQSYNRYAYVRNNPLSYIDPSGFTDEMITVDGVGELGLARAQAMYAQYMMTAGIFCGGGGSEGGICQMAREELRAFEAAFDSYAIESRFNEIAGEMKLWGLQLQMAANIISANDELNQASVACNTDVACDEAFAKIYADHNVKLPQNVSGSVGKKIRTALATYGTDVARLADLNLREGREFRGFYLNDKKGFVEAGEPGATKNSLSFPSDIYGKDTYAVGHFHIPEPGIDRGLMRPSYCDLVVSARYSTPSIIIDASKSTRVFIYSGAWAGPDIGECSRK